MEKKIDIQKGFILSIIIILIISVGFVAVLRYKSRRMIERIAQEEISKKHTAIDEDLVGGIGDTIQVLVFFQNPKLANDPDLIDCGRVFSVVRTVERVPGIARQALQELLLGPTEGEWGVGYQTAISKEIGLHINSVNLDGGTLFIEFNRSPFMGGSCALAGVVSQIKATAMQFPTVKEVKLYVNGNEEWMNP